MTTKPKTAIKKGKAAGTFLDARISGLEEHPAKALLLDGKSIPKQRLISKLRSLQALIQRADDLEVKHSQAIHDRDAALKANAPLLREVDPAIRALVGKDATALKKFGLEPPKVRAPLSAADRVIATQRLNATRKAAGTLGSRQKEAVLDEARGKPQVLVVDTKVAADSPPAPAPAPAPTAAPVPAPKNDAPASSDTAAPSTTASNA